MEVYYDGEMFVDCYVSVGDIAWLSDRLYFAVPMVI